MSEICVATPQDLEFDTGRWQLACDTLSKWCEQGAIPSAALVVGQGHRRLAPLLCGHQRLDGSEKLRNDAIFLIASITKPIVVMGVLQLVERGELALSDRVIEYVPEFGKNGKSGVTIRHLMTHSSGLPDMLPNNVELRQAHAPMSEFVRGICQEPLSFQPGHAVSYQSTGIAILGEIIQRITGLSCPTYLRREVFEPLGMSDSWLGAPANWFEGPQPTANRIAELRVPAEAVGQDWNWNSRYWRMLGAPWGGLLTTATDLAKFCAMMLDDGARPDSGVISRAAITAATRNQFEHMPDIPDTDRRCKPWGLGWRLNWPSHSANFGDFLSSRAYGHWGATGTVMWLDPDSRRYFILLTTQPQEPNGSYLARLSNLVTSAWRT